MAEEGTQTGRVRIEQTADGVLVRMPALRSRWAVLGLVLLLPVGTYVVLGSIVFAGAAAQTAESMGPILGRAFVIALLLVPVAVDLGVLGALVVLLYHLFGAEVVTATPWMLTATRRVLLLGRRRRWPALRVTGLRLSPMAGGAYEAQLVSRRGILFEVDGRRTRAIAEGCTPLEAAEVFEAVRGALTRPTITR